MNPFDMLRLFHNEACQTGSYTLEMHILLIKLREKSACDISGYRVVYVVILYVSKYLVPCCGVRCDFRVKTMFGPSL